MSDSWHPKPLRNQDPNPLFKFEEAEYTVKGRTPIEQQRDADGTPHTVIGQTTLKPTGPAIYVGGKGTSVSKSTSVTKSVDPEAVIKAFLSIKGESTKKAAVPAGATEVAISDTKKDMAMIRSKGEDEDK